MPKVIICKHEYLRCDIGNKVVTWLHRAKKTRKDLAGELGITPQGVSFKINENVFTYPDLLTIFDYLDVPDDEILQVMKIKERRTKSEGYVW